MILASDVKEGTALQLDGKIWKVLEAVHHSGSGQMHGFIELRLHDIRFGHFGDRRFKHSDQLDDVDLHRQQMEYLYSDSEASYFMDPESFEQVSIPKAVIGTTEKFMKEGMKITVELLGEEALTVQFPKVVELKVASTGPGIRGGGDNTTLKPATLENGVEVLVPQFVETGDAVRVDTEKVKYIDRVTAKRV
jgi:elongation factor P